MRHAKNLPLALNDAGAVDLDIGSSPFPEHDGFLEGMVPGVLLPILDVVGELQ